MPNPRVSATLFLTLAGTAGAVPTCPQLVSAGPPALASYLDSPEGSQTAACIEYAIRDIGDKAYAPAVASLVRHLGFRREPGPGSVSMGELWWNTCTSGTRRRPRCFK